MLACVSAQVKYFLMKMNDFASIGPVPQSQHMAKLKSFANLSSSCFDYIYWIEAVVSLKYLIVFLFFSLSCFAYVMEGNIFKGSEMKMIPICREDLSCAKYLIVNILYIM